MPRLTILLLTLTPLLAACGNVPEQPGDLSDRRPEQVDDTERVDPRAEEEAANEIVVPDIDTEVAEVEPSAVYGSWAADEAACAAEGGAPVTISSDRYESTEDSCEISELVSGGDGFTASLRCERGTASEVELLKLRPEDDRLILQWVARDATERELRRCE